VHAGPAAIRVLVSMPMLESAIVVSVSLVCGIRPELCTARFLDAVIFFTGLASAVRPLFFVIEYDYLVHGMGLSVLRLLVSLCLGNEKLGIMFGIVSTLCAVLHKLVSNFPAGQKLSAILIRESFVLIAFVTILSAISWYTARQAELKLQSQMSSQRVNIITTLLDAMCDAVIRLDSDLHFLDPQPKLEALLQASPGSLQKRCFLELLPAGECERASKALLEGSQHSAACLHTSMLDSTGLQVRVQVFHVCMQSLTEGVLHIAGVKEYSSELMPSTDIEVGSVDNPLVSSGTLPPLPETNRAAHLHFEQFEAGRYAEGSSVVSPFKESCPANFSAYEDDSVKEVWLDCTPGRELLVSFRTPAFSRTLGVSAKKRVKLANYMTVGGYADFCDWIESRREPSADKVKVVGLLLGEEEELTDFVVRPISTESARLRGYSARLSNLGFTFELCGSESTRQAL